MVPSQAVIGVFAPLYASYVIEGHFRTAFLSYFFGQLDYSARRATSPSPASVALAAARSGALHVAAVLVVLQSVYHVVRYMSLSG